MKITKEIFNQQRSPRFGTSNPERMRMAFWDWMVRGDETVSSEQKDDENLTGTGLVLEKGKIKSAQGPYRVRQLFGEDLACGDGPIWTFDRMGATQQNCRMAESFASVVSTKTSTTQISSSTTM